jgi:arylsulfatase A-like enzyme
MSTTRRQFLSKSGLFTAGAALGFPAIVNNAFAQRKPNIIYIMADDLGYGDLGCYGQEVIQTPNIDQMALDGMKFTQCYAGSTVCAPSRCCLMTGYHTGHCRVRGNNRHPLLPEDITIAEVLKEAGYTTGMTGKWGLGEPDTSGVPNRQGFDFFYGYLNQARAHNYYPDFLWRNEEREFFEKWTYSHDVITEEALNFIRKNKDNPFFLYIPFTIPHAFNEGGSNGMQIQSDQPYSDTDYPQPNKNMAAMVTHMDRDIGRIFDLLRDLNLEDDTIVFFTSDNGPHREGGQDPDVFNSNGPLRGIKRALYEGGIRVPMIVKWNGHIKAGTENDHIWAFWDFPATAAELAGTVFPDSDGISVVNTLMGKSQKAHDYLYWEFHEQGGRQAIRQNEWKAIRNGWGKPLELYNLDQDLGEQNDIAKQHQDIINKMEALMKQSRTESEHYPIPS